MVQTITEEGNPLDTDEVISKTTIDPERKKLHEKTEVLGRLADYYQKLESLIDVRDCDIHIALPKGGDLHLGFPESSAKIIDYIRANIEQEVESLEQKLNLISSSTENKSRQTGVRLSEGGKG